MCVCVCVFTLTYPILNAHSRLLAELNSVAGAQLCDNFYLRCGLHDEDDDDENDPQQMNGTGCYFFDVDEVRELFTDAGLEVVQLECVTRVYKKAGRNGGKGPSRNGGPVERRRMWVHGKFRKPGRVLEIPTDD